VRIPRPIFIILTAVFVSVPLYYVSQNTLTLARVSIGSEESDAITILTTDQLLEADKEGKVFGHFRALINNPRITVALLSIKPSSFYSARQRIQSKWQTRLGHLSTGVERVSYEEERIVLL
jgi:hypothetical protein